ncbi:MAG TPA: rhomboid family intramembrane serine protease [Pseudobdellovibrionaceae bacterium]|nr:rhomboid family intramembrane serine protease [Pseudobdellovibrionaceae bacterium]
MSFDEGDTSTNQSVIIHHKLVETWLSRDRRKLEDETHLAILSTALLAILISATSLWAWQSDARLSSMAMIRDAVMEQGEWWRLWSMMLVHADVAHWASNLPLMILFGYWLTQYFGWRLFPLTAFIVAGLAHALVLPSYSGEAQVIGASGLVYLMGGTWLSLQFFIQRQFRMGGRLLRVLGVMALLFLPQEYRPHVAERVHMAGLASGLALGTIWFLVFRKKFRAAEVWLEVRDEVDELDDFGQSAEQIRERLDREAPSKPDEIH